MIKQILLLFSVVSLSLSGLAQSDTATSYSTGFFEGFDDSYRGNASIRVAFYNLENLFDTYDDTLKNDESFLPDGDHHWNNYKYYEKSNNLGKTILSIGGWEGVEIVGVCEVENRKVLEDLTKKTVLKQTNYEILHQESPDKRGIDVALLFRPDKIKIDTVQWIQVFLGVDARPTRDILYATLRTSNNAQLHVFVNHWPSRYGGQMKSDPKRKEAARTVRVYIDSIMQSNSKANILLMGDFNDEPENESIDKVLKATNDSTFSDSTHLYNLMSHIHGNHGSHKYQGNWGVLDQFMVNQSLFKGQSHLKVMEGPLVFRPPFLMTKETKYPGMKPYRTYTGFKYTGGYSDHLPIYVDLQLLNQ
ncbi:MAG: endonuclease/exonuclease/phosphatase family protein [Salibacteraceae bacterium]